jgi:hypothetical protein
MKTSTFESDGLEIAIVSAHAYEEVRSWECGDEAMRGTVLLRRHMSDTEIALGVISNSGGDYGRIPLGYIARLVVDCDGKSVGNSESLYQLARTNRISRCKVLFELMSRGSAA